MNVPDRASRRVSYGEPLPPPGEAVATSPLAFEDTLQRLKEAITARDLWLIHEIDPQALLSRDGYEVAPARQLLFFHPRYAARLLAANPAALIEIPLKIAVLQMPDGCVLVRHVDVEAMLSRYAGLAPLASELAILLREVVDALRAPTPKRMG